jgi:hypothetical protein
MHGLDSKAEKTMDSVPILYIGAPSKAEFPPRSMGDRSKNRRIA